MGSVERTGSATGLEQYQDELVNGKTVSEGVRDCADRWKLIEPVLAEYDRPFTVLDLGANLAWFSLKATDEFDCVAVAVEWVYASEMRRVLEANRATRVVGLRQRIDGQWLRRLAEVEHFDVVLALSVAHHFDQPFTTTVELLRQLGDQVILESATEDHACGQARVKEAMMSMPIDARLLGGVVSHLGGWRPTYLMQGNKKGQTRPYMGSPDFSRTNIEIVSTPRHKQYVNLRRDEQRNWWPGINLMTYLASGGMWPTRNDVAGMAEIEWSGKPHGDIRPWNMILSGDRVRLIDFKDPRMRPDRPCPEDDESLKRTVATIRGGVANPVDIQAVFDPLAADHVVW